MPGNRRSMGTQFSIFGTLNNCVDRHEGPKLLGDTIQHPNCVERHCCYLPYPDLQRESEILDTNDGTYHQYHNTPYNTSKLQ